MIFNKYNMIVAADENWCIGKNGQLLDHLPDDMMYFRKITKNKIVMMGKKTQESLPNHLFLKNRINIVFSKEKHDDYYESDKKGDTYVYYLTDINDVPDLIKLINHMYINMDMYANSYMTDGDIFVIGGAQIYKYFLENDLIDTIYLTQIHHKYDDGDTFIPNLYDLGFKDITFLRRADPNETGIKYDIKILKK